MKGDYGILETLKITVLMEDCAGFDTGLLSQHGISMLLEANARRNRKKVLFDSGQSASTLLHNMRLLGIRPADLDMIVLSHCHYDHTGGLAGILREGGFARIPVIAHPAVFRPNFSVRPVFRSVGMGPENSREAVERAGGEMILAAEPLPLLPGTLTSGEISERVDYEKTPTLSLLTIEGGKTRPDPMIDDLSLYFILPDGLVIVTGCAHAGIVSIIEKAVKLTGVDRIAAVIGGFHLVDAEEKRIDNTVETLANMQDALIYTGHCTGLKAEARLLNRLDKRFRKLCSGLKIELPVSKSL